mmetsp:Transcript_37212/g.62573  ORF Transcript_37212/g.62573 Transcript_37212/m.62573 type:complete len:851 (-) Transcript_37212:293-2845(-)
MMLKRNNNIESKTVKLKDVYEGAAALVSAIRSLGSGAGKPFTDITLLVNDGKTDTKIGAHRAILAAWSNQFRNLLAGGGIVSQPYKAGDTIKLKTNNLEAFREFIRFMYNPIARISKQTVNEMLELSLRWEIPALTKQCVAYLQETTRVGDISKIWALGSRLFLSEITEFCEKIAAESIRSIHEELSTKFLAKVLQRDDLGVGSEQEVWKIVEKRIKRLTGSSSKEGDDVDEQIYQLLGSLRISNLPTDFEDAEIVKLDVLVEKRTDSKQLRLKPEYFRVLSRTKRGDREGLRFQDVQELKEGMLVRISANIPKVLEIFRKTRGIHFNPLMAFDYGSVQIVHEVMESRAIIELELNWPLATLEKIPRYELEAMEKERKARRFSQGDQVMCWDQRGSLLPGEVCEVKESKGGERGAQEVRVRFHCWDRAQDLWVESDSPRISPSKLTKKEGVNRTLRHLMKSHRDAKHNRFSKISSDDYAWPPENVDLQPFLIGKPDDDYSANKMGRKIMDKEMHLRRISQLADVRVGSRIQAPRFSSPRCDSAEGDQKVFEERNYIMSEEIPKLEELGINIMESVLMLWDGETDEVKLTRNLATEGEKVVMRSILESTKTHIHRQDALEKKGLPDVLVTEYENGDERLQALNVAGLYKFKQKFKGARPVFEAEHGKLLQFNKGPERWEIVDGSTLAVVFRMPDTVGFIPPLGEHKFRGHRINCSFGSSSPPRGGGRGNEVKTGNGRNSEKSEDSKSTSPPSSSTNHESSDIETLEQLIGIYSSFCPQEGKVATIIAKLRDMGFLDKQILKAVNTVGCLNLIQMMRCLVNADEEEDGGVHIPIDAGRLPPDLLGPGECRSQ